MKTRHVTWSDGYNVLCNIREALKDARSLKNNLRIISCGRGAVILPDTNCKADCTEGELIKALGLVKMYDGLHLEGDMKSEDEKLRKLVSMQYEYDTPHLLSLTEDQTRLLDWLSEHGYLDGSINYNYLQSFAVQKI